MSGFLDLKCSIIKGGMKMLPVVGPSPLCVNPIFEIGPLEPRYSEWLVFEVKFYFYINFRLIL